MANEYKVFKSVEKRPLDNGIWEDGQMETLINKWAEEGFEVDVINSTTTIAGDFLLVETTVTLCRPDFNNFDDYDDGDDDYDDSDDNNDDDSDEDYDDEDDIDVIGDGDDDDRPPRHRW
jgi:hypothetical protein